jgi:type II secretory pathway component GspD/PulD (secretin)
MFGPTILSIVNTQIALDFLKQQTDTKFLARPRILTLNNETAEIKITTNEAIGVKSTTSSSGGSATGTVTNEAERYETGVSLRITPQIDADTGEITMFANPTVSEASTSQTSFDTGTGSTASFLNPETRSAKATVRVKDGETVVLGGLIRNQTSTVIKKYPVLGDMPIFGKLFTHKDVSPGKERELLVFITPHIIKNGDLRADSAKKVPMLQREQAVVSTMGRQQSIKAYLNNFERQR